MKIEKNNEKNIQISGKGRQTILRLRQNNRKRIEKHKSNKMKRRKRKIDKVFE